MQISQSKDIGDDKDLSEKNYTPKYTIYTSAPVFTNKCKKIRNIITKLWFLRLKLNHNNVDIFMKVLSDMYLENKYNAYNNKPIYLYIDVINARYSDCYKDICKRIHTVNTSHYRNPIPYSGCVLAIYKNVCITKFTEYHAKVKDYFYMYKKI